MTASTTAAIYRRALSAPGALAPVLFSLVARMPVAMLGMSTLLYVNARAGSFATASLASAAMLVGIAVGAIAQGRVIDRLGPTVPLIAISGLFTISVTLMIASVEFGVPLWALLISAVLSGVTQPAGGPASRALWPHLVKPGDVRQAAYAYEAISMETFFILGPALSGALILAPWAGTGVVVATVMMSVGTIGFALTPAVRQVSARAQSLREEHRLVTLLGSINSAGMRTLAIAVLGLGLMIGFVEVAIPAEANQSQHRALGGALLAVWSGSSVLVGIWWGVRPWPRRIHLRLPTLLALMALSVPLLALPDGLWGLSVALVVAGALITPQSTAHSSSIDYLAPAGMQAEAFAWVLTAITVGLALGQATSGQLLERFGTGATYLVAGAVGMACAAVVFARRDTLRVPDRTLERRRNDLSQQAHPVLGHPRPESLRISAGGSPIGHAPTAQPHPRATGRHRNTPVRQRPVH